MFRADDDAPADGVAQSDSLSPDDAFGVLADRHRRTVIKSLLGCKHGVPVETLVNDLLVHAEPSGPDPRRQVATELYHVHLPKLADLGLVEWDRTHEVVTPTTLLSSLAPLIQGITLGRFYR